MTQQEIINTLNKMVETIPYNRLGYEFLEVNQSCYDVLDETQQICADIIPILSSNSIPENYIKTISTFTTTALSQLFFKDEALYNVKNESHNRLGWKTHVEQHVSPNLRTTIKKLEITVKLFIQLNFFSDNIVAIGANGSGKSSLSIIFKEILGKNGVSISAQRILLIPKLEHVQNTTEASKTLREYQTRDKTNKDDNYSYLNSEFRVILNNLIAENVASNSQFRKKAREAYDSGHAIPPPEMTNLEKALILWNGLIEHRRLTCEDGINIVVHTPNGDTYQPVKMSDGEKVTLFLIAQALQAPKNGFIVIDEPEIYLHKAILKKLWDKLEQERNDCIFIYLTHDLDFAASRINSKKLWIKSFNHPDEWIFEPLPTDELPETLLMELLGSRKTILFCEGDKGSLDEQILNIIYPNLTITPVGSCFNVVNYTRAFNKLKTATTTAIGIIDTDYRTPAEILQLNADGIYNYKVAEIENLLLDETLLTLLSQQLMKEKTVVDELKEALLNKLHSDRELNIAHYISSRVNYTFKASHVAKGNTSDEVKDNLMAFNATVNIDEWYAEREAMLNNITNTKNYHQAILAYNNKGLKGLANRIFKIHDFTESALKLLQRNQEAQKALKKHFPPEIESTA
ncbi:MAG: ATP-binding protein [Taibaiella sp.]|nr:ATP-binding protein [Taibaiella sp.]